MVSRDASPAMDQPTPLTAIVFLATSTTTEIEERSSGGLTRLPACISSTVPQHDNNTSAALALLLEEATRQKIRRIAFIVLSINVRRRLSAKMAKANQTPKTAPCKVAKLE